MFGERRFPKPPRFLEDSGVNCSAWDLIFALPKRMRFVAVEQQAIDKVARTFYSALGIAGCISSLGFVALGLYGVTSESILRNQLFFAGLAASGVGVGIRSIRFLKHVLTHDDLPSDTCS